MPLQQGEKERQQDAGVDGLGAKLPPAGQKADDEQHDIQDHCDGRQRQWHKVCQHDAKARDAADRGVARNQKEVDRRRNDRNRPGQDGKLLHGGKRGSVFFVCHLDFLLIRPVPAGEYYTANRWLFQHKSGEPAAYFCVSKNRISGPLNV